MTKKIRLTVDAVMVILLPMLMAYALIGEAVHEILGTAMLALLIAHHLLNRRFYGAIRKGRYGADRVFRTALDGILLIALLLQPVSGILLSRHLYTFIPALPAAATAREIHMVCAYWSFLLMGVHTGTHLRPLRNRMKKRKAAGIAFGSIVLLIAAYGGYAFFKRGLPEYLIHKNAFAFFDFDEPVVWFLADYAAITVLAAAIGFGITEGLSRLSRGRNGNRMEKRRKR